MAYKEFILAYRGVKELGKYVIATLGRKIDEFGDKISRESRLCLDCFLSYSKPVPELTEEELRKCRNFVKKELAIGGSTKG